MIVVMDALLAWFKSNVLQAGLLLLGLVMMGIGGWQWLTYQSQGEEVEVVQAAHDDVDRSSKVVVDVAGAVVSPGVYQLESGSRLSQAIEQAGGLVDSADTEWIAKMINLAERVKDGQKIYIPHRSSTDSRVQETESSDGKINVNTALATELENLWGIGESRAQDIISNRPYSTLEDLNTKAHIPATVLEKNTSTISFY